MQQPVPTTTHPILMLRGVTALPSRPMMGILTPIPPPSPLLSIPSMMLPLPKLAALPRMRIRRAVAPWSPPTSIAQHSAIASSPTAAKARPPSLMQQRGPTAIHPILMPTAATALPSKPTMDFLTLIPPPSPLPSTPPMMLPLPRQEL